MGDCTEKRKPNILFIMTDQMRGDCMGVAGHPDVKTPYLDHLASSIIPMPIRPVPVVFRPGAPYIPD